jgi:hypothetical protein
LAAKQQLKAQVQIAMADGIITSLERAEILNDARDILTVKEYESLKATMDRLSPPEKATATAKQSNSQRAAAGSMHDHSDSSSFLGRLASQVPYVEDMSIGPHPKISDIPKNIPYVKPSIDTTEAKQALAKASRLKDTYIDMPTADRPLPKVSHIERTSTASLSHTATKPVLSRKTSPVEKQPMPKYADESIEPPMETETAEPNVVQQPTKVREEMGPLAEQTENRLTLAIPAGAILPDRSVRSATAEYDQPMQPSRIEMEFVR